ncbi:Ras family, other [Cryptococcus deuterogattii LA55]|nr:Ras family, other [Cryptococcus deuterogattii LA55]KIR72415.1 Ras family, other [Cryptococcus deuterogattii CA1014]KIR92008.1 Ras family, other [Cryptococcus deuterogattii CBS 10090]
MLFKITVLGDGGVGKTAITVQFTMSSFVETYDPTIEDCYRKQWVVDDQPCLLEVLDTAGQEEYTALRDQWIREGEGFLIVYSITSRPTFERVEHVVERVLRVKDESGLPLPSSSSNPYGLSTSAGGGAAPGAGGGGGGGMWAARVPIVIVGNKKDMFHSREVSTDEGASLAKRLGCEFFEVSAKTNSNVEAAFKCLVKKIKLAKQGGAGEESVMPTERVGGKRKKKYKCVVL